MENQKIKDLFAEERFGYSSGITGSQAQERRGRIIRA